MHSEHIRIDRRLFVFGCVMLFVCVDYIQKWLMNVSVSMTILCSCEMAANSLSHSSSRTAHMAKSRVRLLLFVIAAATFGDEFEMASIDEYVELSFDDESYDELCADSGDNSRTVEFEPDTKRKKGGKYQLSSCWDLWKSLGANKTERKISAKTHYRK